ncbi:trafficking protein particle complex subunit 2 [Microdochium nivale]|nr:trafficking protein particle complex subunit 2 [Microdochium nivale]
MRSSNQVGSSPELPQEQTTTGAAVYSCCPTTNSFIVHHPKQRSPPSVITAGSASYPSQSPIMAHAIPSVACLGVIGRNNNPLHITIFPSHNPSDGTTTNTTQSAPLRTPLQFSLLLSSTLDVFARRAQHAASTGTLLSGDFGMLHAVDERLAAYGFETNTGVKFVAVVDMRGRLPGGKGGGGPGSSSAGNRSAAGGTSGGGTGGAPNMTAAAAAAAGSGVGLREGELKVVFRAMQTAYVRLLQNPFYDPDEHSPLASGRGGKRITSRKFAEEMRRIGETWAPGVTNL